MKFLDFFHDYILPYCLSVLFIVIFVFLAVIIKSMLVSTNCTPSQLHEVIQAVEMCKDANVICNEKMKDEIIAKVCK